MQFLHSRGSENQARGRQQHGLFQLRLLRQIAIEGNIQNDSFTGRDGTKKTAVKIVCDNVEFADGKGKDWEPPKDDKLKEHDEGFLSIPDGAIDEELPFV